MNTEDLRKEFYKVMEYNEPFGNEYHDELFNWMISKIELQKEELNKQLTEKDIVIDKYISKLHKIRALVDKV